MRNVGVFGKVVSPKLKGLLVISSQERTRKKLIKQLSAIIKKVLTKWLIRVKECVYAVYNVYSCKLLLVVDRLVCLIL